MDEHKFSPERLKNIKGMYGKLCSEYDRNTHQNGEVALVFEGELDKETRYIIDTYKPVHAPFNPGNFIHVNVDRQINEFLDTNKNNEKFNEKFIVTVFHNHTNGVSFSIPDVVQFLRYGKTIHELFLDSEDKISVLIKSLEHRVLKVDVNKIFKDLTALETDLYDEYMPEWDAAVMAQANGDICPFIKIRDKTNEQIWERAKEKNIFAANRLTIRKTELREVC